MLLAQEAVDVDNAEYLRRRLAVESISTADVIGLFRQLLPKSSDVIRAYLPALSDLESREHSTKKLDTKVYRDVVKKVEGISYVAFADTLVVVPEGFHGLFTPYLETLLVQNKTLDAFVLETLKDYNLQLAMFLSNADYRQSLKSHQANIDKVRKTRAVYEKALSTYFDKQHTSLSRRRLGDVINRFADLQRLFEKAEELEGVRQHRSYHETIEHVKKASDMLVLIRQRLDQDDISKVSGVVAKDLSDGAYEVAKLVEVLSVYGYHTETALAAVNRLAEQLKTLF